MRLPYFILNASKIIVLLFFVAVGFKTVYEAHLSTVMEIPPESPLLFQKTMHPSAGPDVGTVKIKMIPTKAFVVGDHILAEIEVHVFGVNWHGNESCQVQMLFTDAICYIDSWSNITKQDWTFYWWKYESHNAVYAIYQKEVTLWYVHEGIYGLNVTVWQPSLHPFGYNEFYFPDLVHIKSYTYLEEQKRANLEDALTVEVLGLTYIAIGPVAVQFINLIGKLVKSSIEKKKGEQRSSKWASYE